MRPGTQDPGAYTAARQPPSRCFVIQPPGVQYVNGMEEGASGRLGLDRHETRACWNESVGVARPSLSSPLSHGRDANHDPHIPIMRMMLKMMMITRSLTRMAFCIRRSNLGRF